MHRFFTPERTLPEVEESNSWLDTLKNASGWLNPFHLVRKAADHFSLSALVFVELIRPVKSLPDTLSEQLHYPYYFPTVQMEDLTHYVTCITRYPKLQQILLNRCNITNTNSTKFSTYLLELDWPTEIHHHASSLSACELYPHININASDYCIKMLKAISQCRFPDSSRLYFLMSFASIGLGILSIFSIVYYLRSLHVSEEELSLSFYDDIRHGNLEAVEDYIREHRNQISHEDLNYAIHFAEANNQDAIYRALAILHTERMDELAVEPPSRIEVIDDRIAINEEKLKAAGYDLSEIHASFLDPVTLSIMDEPVTLCNGQTFDRSTLLDLKARGINTCPITKAAITEREFNNATNINLKRLIEEFVLTIVNAPKIKKTGLK